ncbi:alcohol dehydrogenase catalytic domain-containing protein [Blastococcus sp. KM273128]|uniref:alcohol dehydrogenase catalytic domain-containing protein n=1 Tax=Blastococcus sp. KM273128 TaxID=2570314 RepID=UPI001F17D166|nr:alcohol dehydrogenase catalytic domain-containing protein [Blastococcus sp. KM273128]
MKAATWAGVNEIAVEDVPEPTILNDRDVILKIRQSVTCGSDLHLVGGYIPFMRAGDVMGHEFIGEVVEVGREVRDRKVGDRVVVAPFAACGSCWYCRQELYSLCDNGNPDPGITEGLWGQSPGGCFGYSHAMGGYAGSHAEYMRVPYADVGTFVVPEAIPDTRAVFASDAASTGWMGADLAGTKPGDVVAVWGAGGVGQMAARAAMLLGAEQVVVVDRVPERLQQVREHIGAEAVDYTSTDVVAELRERTGGRGPDVCIEAVGMEAHAPGAPGIYD